MTIPLEKIDPEAEKVVRRLVRGGYAAYLVGGCVRDLLVGRRPKDFDVATSATPNETKDLFRNCRIIGRRFRLAHIFFGSKIIETSTFRANPREVDGVPEDEELLIRRDNVFGTAEEDARRRDFTINGLFYDLEAGRVIDYVGGVADLEARLVRTIGDPDIRFREDPVRILRAIKFAARLQFDFEPATYAAILTHRGEIAKCAPPRVLEEIYRLLRGAAARRSMELLLETGVADILFPELVAMFRGDPTHPPNTRERAWRILEELDDKLQDGYPEEREPARLLPTPAPTAATPPESTPAPESTPGPESTPAPEPTPVPVTVNDLQTVPVRSAPPLVSPFARPTPPAPPPNHDAERERWAAVWSSDPASTPAPAPAVAAAAPTPPPPPRERERGERGDRDPRRHRDRDRDRDRDNEPHITRAPLPPRYQPTNAVLLSLLAVPMLPFGDDDGRVDPLAEIDRVLGPLAERMRASRRDQERARQILLAQRRLAPSTRRRNRPMMLVRRDWFDEALTVFQLSTRADGLPEDEVIRWRALARRGASSPHDLDEGGELDAAGEGGAAPGDPNAPGEPASTDPNDPNGRPRRRRRRGGRRRRRGPGDSSALDPV